MKKSLEEKCFDNKINDMGTHTWMCDPGGDGELEIRNQGRSRDSSFAQETIASIQYQSRIDVVPILLEEVQDARLVLYSSSPFFFYGRSSRLL